MKTDLVFLAFFPASFGVESWLALQLATRPSAAHKKNSTQNDLNKEHLLSHKTKALRKSNS